MNWRQFKTPPTGTNGEKEEKHHHKDDFSTFSTFSPERGTLTTEPDNLVEESLFQLIKTTLVIIDGTPRSWDGWRQSLSPSRRQRLKEIEFNIDKTYRDLNRSALQAALDEYRRICLSSDDTFDNHSPAGV